MVVMTFFSKSPFALFAIFLIASLVLLRKCDGKPWTQTPIDETPPSKPVAVVSCTPETESICQRCAKQTKSVVVYPWCCSNHEGAREWCENYLYYGLR